VAADVASVAAVQLSDHSVMMSTSRSSKRLAVIFPDFRHVEEVVQCPRAYFSFDVHAQNNLLVSFCVNVRKTAVLVQRTTSE